MVTTVITISCQAPTGQRFSEKKTETVVSIVEYSKFNNLRQLVIVLVPNTDMSGEELSNSMIFTACFMLYCCTIVLKRRVG